MRRERMGSDAGKPADDVIHIALGVDLKKEIPNLLWVLNNFPGIKIVIVHVHRVSKWIPTMGTKFLDYMVSEEYVLQHRDKEKKKMFQLLQKYVHVCSKTKVQVGALVIIRDDVFKGLEALVSMKEIKRLVMGSRFIAEQDVLLRRCQIWLVSNGKHISTSDAVLVTDEAQREPENNHGEMPSFSDSDDRLLYVTPPNELEDEPIGDQEEDQNSTHDAASDARIESLRMKMEILKKQLDEAEDSARRAIQEKSDLERRLAETENKIADQDRDLHELRMPRNTMEFSMQEISLATKNFHPSQKIGEGGYGPVFRGLLRHTHVAIKLLNSEGKQGRREFEQEVQVLSTVRHQHMVVLIGINSETCSLIYEYLPSGNLEARLARKNNTPALSWQTRVRIIAEQRSALVFLQSCRPRCIVHCDVKLANIFLDANNVSRLGDFGTARFISQCGSSEPCVDICRHNTTPMGTMGYMDPTFFSTGELMPSSDTYSFGIVILRMVTGLPVLRIAAQVEEALRMGALRQILDATAGEWPVVQTEQLLRLALRCCHMERESRPSLVCDDWRTLEILCAMAGT